MKRIMSIAATFTLLSTVAAAWGGEAETSATAGGHRYRPNGTAAATARYTGDIGFAQTRSRSGKISTARGLAVGFDENGLTLSASNAVAGRFGLAVATNFNLSIGIDGSISHSQGAVVAIGPVHHSASAGGRATAGRHDSGAVSRAAGRSDRRGSVQARTDSRSYRPLRRGHHRPRGARIVRRRR